MATITEDLERRLKKLEDQSFIKFLIQTLVTPISLIILGAIINYTVEKSRLESQRIIERSKIEVQQIDMAQKMIPLLFDTDHRKAFIAIKLFRQINNTGLADSIEKISSQFYIVQIKQDVAQGNLEAANEKLAAAQNVGGNAAQQVAFSIRRDAKTYTTIGKFRTKLDSAAYYEQMGFQHIIKDNFEEARKAFEKSEDIYNGYHNVYEIGRLLRKNQADISNPNAQKQIVEEILQKYYYGISPEVKAQLEQKLSFIQ